MLLSLHGTRYRPQPDYFSCIYRVDEFLSRSLSAEAVKTLQHIRSLPTYRDERKRSSGTRRPAGRDRNFREEYEYDCDGNDKKGLLDFQTDLRQLPPTSPGSTSVAGLVCGEICAVNLWVPGSA